MELVLPILIFVSLCSVLSCSEPEGFMKHGVEGFMKLCPAEECQLDQNHFESKEYKLKLYKLFSAGVPQILWDHFREQGSSWSLSKNSLNISSQCHDGFKSVWSGIEDGDEWAFKCKLNRWMKTTEL